MPIVAIPTLREYYIDLDKVLDISSDGPSKSFAFRRLQYLEGKWNLYILLNEHQEMADSKVRPPPEVLVSRRKAILSWSIRECPIEIFTMLGKLIHTFITRPA